MVSQFSVPPPQYQEYFFWSLWKPNNIQGVSGGIVNIFSGPSGNPTIYRVFQEE